MSDTTLIGPLGNLLEVRCPAPNLAAPQQRASSETETLGGRRVVSRAPASRRRWAWNLSRATPADVAALVALEQGVYGPPPWWWYDPLVAATNMLRPADAVPGLGGAALSWTPTDATVAAAGSLAHSSIPGGSVSSSMLITGTNAGAFYAELPLIPVVAGRTYTAAAVLSPVTANGARMVMSWRTAADVATGTLANGSLVTTLGRASVTAVAPAGAAGVRVRVSAFNGIAGNTIQASAVQLVEGALRDWSPGEGMPRVVISGLDRAYQQVWDDGTVRTDYAAELVEVG